MPVVRPTEHTRSFFECSGCVVLCVSLAPCVLSLNSNKPQFPGRTGDGPQLSSVLGYSTGGPAFAGGLLGLSTSLNPCDLHQHLPGSFRSKTQLRSCSLSARVTPSATTVTRSIAISVARACSCVVAHSARQLKRV